MSVDFTDISLPGEIWRPAKGFSSNYYVSNMGRILTTKHYGWYKTAVMKPGLYEGYYRTVMDGKTIKVHRVVAQTWLDNPDNLPVVNHKDFDRINNRVENLEWTTIQGNGIHAYKHGRLHPLGIGESATRAKYKDSTIVEIIDWWKVKTLNVPLKDNRTRHQLYIELSDNYPHIPISVLRTICQRGWKYRPSAFGQVKPIIKD